MLETYFHRIYTEYLNIVNTIYPKTSPYQKLHNLDDYMSSFFIEEKKAKRCGAIIFSTDMSKILLVKNRQSKKWGLPKGAIKPYENFSQCAFREVWEETGIDLYSYGQIIDNITINDTFYLVVHLKQKVQLKIIDKKEVQALGFVDIDKIPQLNSNLSLKSFYIYHQRLTNKK